MKDKSYIFDNFEISKIFQFLYNILTNKIE